MSLDDLLRAVRAGEPRAKQRLFRELRTELMRYFRRRVAESDAEDLVQLTSVIVLLELDTFKAKGPRTFRR